MDQKMLQNIKKTCKKKKKALNNRYNGSSMKWQMKQNLTGTSRPQVRHTAEGPHWTRLVVFLMTSITFFGRDNHGKQETFFTIGSASDTAASYFNQAANGALWWVTWRLHPVWWSSDCWTLCLWHQSRGLWSELHPQQLVFKVVWYFSLSQHLNRYSK